MGHKMQIPHKFYFNLDFSKIENLPKEEDTEYVLILERRDKLQSSESFRSDRNGCANLSERLSMDATLFRPEDALEFQNKQVKIAVRLGRMNGKTAAKIHVDLGKYAKAPSGEIDVKLKMTNGVFLYVRIASSLVKSGRSTGPSSLFSAMTTGSGGLSRVGDTDLDDLNDLEFGDDQDFLASTKLPPGEDKEMSADEKIGLIVAGDLPPTVKNIELVLRSNEQLSKTLEVDAEDEANLRTQIEHVREQLEAMDNHEIEDGVEQELELEKLRVELELLTEDHQMLTEENEELQEVVLNENLRREERLDVQELEEEFQELKDALEALEEEFSAAQKEVSREPQESELHAELSSTKMLLGTITMEAEKAARELDELKSQQPKPKKKHWSKSFRKLRA
ncbi:hypothetical protein NDN08_002695 [Rhodosorus marinus]|uniref:C2 NT-type domain-containing protein n=1 Tax=Rhodosorus marinus TaxID=101924 RepID=A0AAV8UUF5_9RHOD|nr:hypothetical protein NDN08_002695 [Rhodosorus marinus]